MNKRTSSDSPLNLAYLIATQIALIVGISPHNAREQFNPAHLETGAGGLQATDLSAFEEHGGQQPGRYRVDIYVNDSKVDTGTLSSAYSKTRRTEHITALPVPERFGLMGRHDQRYPTLGQPDASCARLSAIPQASADFRFSHQQLLLSFPQSSLTNAARGWVDPARWDDGIRRAGQLQRQQRQQPGQKRRRRRRERAVH
ncbi:MAG: FimD/PapC N-terminal domain-containing protein [Enterobacteriaceae bacterium]